MNVTCIDFGRSFATWLLKERPSHGRWMLDSTLSVIGENGMVVERYHLLSAVMAGRVYAESNLVVEPTMEFRPVFGSQAFKMFRTHATYLNNDDSGIISDKFKDVNFNLKMIPAEAQTNPHSIAQAALRNEPLVGRVSLDRIVGGYYELEFPVKHINIESEKWLFQIETGPVLVPSRRAPSMPTVDDLEVAYLFFNRLHEIHILNWNLTSIANSQAYLRFFDKPWKSLARIEVLAPSSGSG